MSKLRISLIAALVGAFTFSGAEAAVGTELATLSDAQLQGRWNKQADEYDKGYLLESCESRRVQNSDRSFLLCGTAGGKGVISFRRKGGKLENVEYTMKGAPMISASMFMRFVRGTQLGNMGEVGSNLLLGARKDGNACVDEPTARVCALFSSGEYLLAAAAKQR